MRLLLDTHILVALARPKRSELGGETKRLLAATENASFVSAASLWEIAIKWRLRKLEIEVAPDDLARYFEAMDLGLLAVDHRHAVRDVTPEPQTRDPFDRLLLGQCAVEEMRLVTSDRFLAVHPLAIRAS